MKRFLSKRLPLLLTLSLLLGLTACQPQPTKHFRGLVTEVQTSAEGEPLSLLVQTDSGDQVGILLTEETHISPLENGTYTRPALWAELKPDVEVLALCFPARKTLTTQDGQKFPAYESRNVEVTGRLTRGGAVLKDGTVLDVMERTRHPAGRTYSLPDGVDLLTVAAPSGPANVFSGGLSLSALSEAAQEKVVAFYEERGLLYDEAALLELVYAQWKTMGEDFSSYYLEQSTSPSASSSQVMYFLTTVTIPTAHGDNCTNYDLQLGDAFDRETGEHLDPWDLFTCPKEEAIAALLKADWISESLRAEMEAAFTPERMVLFPDHISMIFERGSLPSQEHDYSLSVELSDLPGLLQDWALPLSSEAQ